MWMLSHVVLGVLGRTPNTSQYWGLALQEREPRLGVYPLAKRSPTTPDPGGPNVAITGEEMPFHYSDHKTSNCLFLTKYMNSTIYCGIFEVYALEPRRWLKSGLHPLQKWMGTRWLYPAWSDYIGSVIYSSWSGQRGIICPQRLAFVRPSRPSRHYDIKASINRYC